MNQKNKCVGSIKIEISTDKLKKLKEDILTIVNKQILSIKLKYSYKLDLIKAIVNSITDNEYCENCERIKEQLLMIIESEE